MILRFVKAIIFVWSGVLAPSRKGIIFQKMLSEQGVSQGPNERKACEE